MLNESASLLSLNDLKEILLQDVTIFNVALTYILIYVIYKTLGRYIYFKPQEHASKINRTTLVLSLLVILLHFLHKITNYLPFLSEYRWLYAICVLVLLIAPFSIIMDRVVWRYDNHGHKYKRYSHYMPIPPDYYKTAITRRTAGGSLYDTVEEEGVESTERNLHSDALLNIFSLVVFITVMVRWAYESVASYGSYSLIFSGLIILWIVFVFVNNSVFSWITYAQQRYYNFWITFRSKRKK